MRKIIYPDTATAFSKVSVWQNFPWSKITLPFLMISTFMIFATTGANGAETVASWTGHVGEIIAATAVFSLATVFLISAGRLLPKNI